MNKKLLIVVPALKGGGSERVLITMMNALVNDGYSIVIGMTISNQCDYKINEKVHLIVNNKSVSWKGQIKFIRQLLKQYMDYSVLSFFTYQSMYLSLASIGLKNKIILSERNDPRKTVFRKGMGLLRCLLYMKADVLVFQTPDAKNNFPKNVRKKGVVIPNPIKENLPLPFEGVREKRFVACSRLNEQKNLPLLIDAFADVVNEYPEYVLEIYGKGHLLQDLLSQCEQKGISDKVLFKGFCENLHERIICATAFVSSSDYEGISNSLIEAMGIGLPVISTDCPVGGARMFIENNQNGLLVPVGQKEALAEAMLQVIREPKKAQAMGKKAIAVNEEISVEKIMQQWKQIIG